MKKNYNFLPTGFCNFLQPPGVCADKVTDVWLPDYVKKAVMLVTTLLFMLNATATFAQSGETCDTAIDLASLTSPFSGTTTGAVNDYSITCANGNASPDLFYFIEVPNGYTLVIGQTENGYDSENYMGYGGACPGTTQIACFDDNDIQNITWVNTTGASQTVYWVQDGYNTAANAGTFTLAWTLTPPPTCVVPMAVTAVAALDGTANLSWTAPTAGGTPVGYEYAVSTSATPPASGTEITGTSVANYPGIAPSTMYYLHVRTNCGTTDGYSQWVTSIAFQSPIGDTCESAINLGTLTSPISASTVGFNNDSTYTCAGGNTSPDIFYYIEVPNGYTLVIGQTVNGYDSENYMAYGTTCPGTTQIACFDDADIQNITWVNTTGATQNVYWIQDGYNNAAQAGTFTLAWTLTPPPTCVVPNTVAAVAFADGTANLSWVGPTAGGTPEGYEYAVTTSATPPASGTATTALSVTGYTTITPATIYYLHVRTNCGTTNGFSQWVTSAPFQYLQGDNCGNAINLGTLTSPLTGTTVGAANDSVYTCAGGNTSPDLFYYVEVPNGYTLVIGQTENGYDSENYMAYGTTCPGTTQIACFDDNDIQNITWVNTTGTTQNVYWIQDGYNNATQAGTFTLAWTLTPPPTCVVPSAVTGVAALDGTANLSWEAPTAGGTPVGYEYAVTTSATPPVSGTAITETTVTNYPGIAPSTMYYLHVRTNCGTTNGYSEWVTSAPFQSLIGDNCESAINLGTLTSPISASTVGFNNDSTYTCAGGNTSPDIFYYIEVPSGYTLVIGQTANGYDSENYMAYGTTCPGTTQIACFDDADIQDITWENTTGATQNVYWIQDGYNNAAQAGTFTLAWTLTAPPTCNIPTALTTQLTSVSTVDISWSVPVTGTPVGYEYAVTTSATPPASGTATTALSVTGATATEFATNYVFVRTNCGPDGYSDWVVTSFYAGHCVPAPTSVDGDGITNVTIGSINNTTGEETNNYGDYTAQVVNVGQGVAQPFSITFSTGFTYNTRVWIDWNNDLDFTDEGEEVFAAESTNANPTTLTGSFTVPANATLGNYRIRIGGTDGTGITPCYTGAYGSFEDYTLNVTTPPSCFTPLSPMGEGVASNTANLSWSAPVLGATPTGYEYFVSTSTVSPASGTPTTETSVTGYTGIEDNTIYYLHVRTNCGNGDYSEWVVSPGFRYLMGDACASAINLASQPNPYSYTTVGANNDSVYTCAGGNTSPDLFYYIDVPNGYTLTIGQTANGYDSEIYVAYGNTCPGQTQLACYDDPDIQNTVWENLTGSTQTVYWIQDGYNNATQAGTFTIAWTLVGPVTCDVPRTPTVSLTSETTATVSWTAPNTGSPAGYEYLVSTSQVAPTTGYIFTTDLSVAGVAITPNATNYLWVRSNCGDTDGNSLWVSTSFYGGYCLPTSTNNNTYYISGVTTTGAQTNFANTGTGVSGYTDYTQQFSVTTFAGGTFDVTATHPGNANTQYTYSVWVDWNRDFDFEDAGELEIFSEYMPSPAQIGSVTVPLNAAEGSYRMRIRNANVGSPTPVCGNFIYGEAEDYTLVVGPTPSCFAPYILTITPIDATTADLSWSPSLLGNYPVGYQYALTTSPTPPEVGEYTEAIYVGGVTYNPAVSTYLHVRSVCGQEDFSPWETTAILDATAPELVANSVIVYKEGNVINITSGNTLMTGVTIYDTRGRKLYTQNGINATQAAIDDMQIQQQVLIIQVDTEKGKVSKRIVY